MTFFDITPVGAFLNAIDAAAEKDRQIARLETKRGTDLQTSPSLQTRPEPKVCGTIRGTVEACLNALSRRCHAQVKANRGRTSRTM